MKYILSDEEEYYDTESRNLDEEKIVVSNANGYGRCDVEIQAGIMTWEQVDMLKEAIRRSEERWRKQGKSTP